MSLQSRHAGMGVGVIDILKSMTGVFIRIHRFYGFILNSYSQSGFLMSELVMVVFMVCSLCSEADVSVQGSSPFFSSVQPLILRHRVHSLGTSCE